MMQKPSSTIRLCKTCKPFLPSLISSRDLTIISAALSSKTPSQILAGSSPLFKSSLPSSLHVRFSQISTKNPAALKYQSLRSIHDVQKQEQDEQVGASVRINTKTGIYDHNPDEFSSDVERVYRFLRKFHSSVPKLELALNEYSVSVGPGFVARVLNRCGDAGNLAFRFFVWASKQPGYKHSYECYKMMIKILGKMRQFGTVWALLEEMRKENPELITSETFIVLMRRFAASRMVKKAIEVLDEMPKFGCEPDEHAFGCLLDALCKNDSVKEAASLFEDMRVRFKPNLRHFTSLLYGWCKAGRLIEAKFVLIQIREAGFDPDIVVYNTLLTGYATAGKMEDGYELLHEMRSKGCPPNAASYTILIQGLCARDRMEEAMRFLAEMCRNGCVADVITYTTLIKGFCKAGKIDRAYELLDGMIQKGVSPNQMTYFCILGAHEKREELEECLELVSEMKKAGCVPDLSIYNTVIRMSSKLGQQKEVENAWIDIEANGLSPGLDTFTIMIHGLLGQGLLIDACKYFKEMVGRGLLSAPQYGTLKELLNALLRAGKLEMAMDTWDTIVNKGCDLNVCAYTIWIHALFDHGHVKEACTACLEMMESDLLPQPDTFAKLMRGLNKMYNRLIAKEVTDRVMKMCADRNITFKYYKRRGVRDEVEKRKLKADGRKQRVRRHKNHTANL